MAKQTINLGTAPTGVGGDTPRSAFTKAQSNIDELYAALGASGSPAALPSALPVELGGTGGTTQAAARTGLGLGSAAVAAIVGTVSQNGGDVMQVVTNANGTAFKFASGVMLCLSPPLSVAGTTASFGALFISPTATGWFYPVAFVGASPYVGGVNGNSAQFSINARTTSISSSEFVGIYPASSSGALTVFAFAIGRCF